MNLWECEEPGCDATAVGEGGAVGLRAIGWYFQPGPVILCPRHRPDPIPCVDPGVPPEERAEKHGKPCPSCRAAAEADRIQATLATDEDTTIHEHLANEPIVVTMSMTARRRPAVANQIALAQRRLREGLRVRPPGTPLDEKGREAFKDLLKHEHEQLLTEAFELLESRSTHNDGGDDYNDDEVCAWLEKYRAIRSP